MIAGKIPKDLVIKDDFTKYHPVFAGDLYKVIIETLTNPSHQGKTYSVNGKDDLTINQILGLI